jgi:hypothetical protein
MIQSWILGALIFLCILLIISIIGESAKPSNINFCKFKILPPKFKIDGNSKKVVFDIIVKKRHKYFINFPLLFKFYSDSKFLSSVVIFYLTPEEEKQKILDKKIEFNTKVKEHTLYITDVILGSITIQIELEVDYGNPSIEFRILENSTCKLSKEHKLDIIFPQ